MPNLRWKRHVSPNSDERALTSRVSPDRVRKESRLSRAGEARQQRSVRYDRMLRKPRPFCLGAWSSRRRRFLLPQMLRFLCKQLRHFLREKQVSAFDPPDSARARQSAVEPLGPLHTEKRIV